MAEAKFRVPELRRIPFTLVRLDEPVKFKIPVLPLFMIKPFVPKPATVPVILTTPAELSVNVATPDSLPRLKTADALVPLI